MIAAILEYEAKVRQELQAFDAKAGEVVAKKKEELEILSASQLKDLCAEKSLAVGGDKSEKIARLLEHCRTDGEIDASVSATLFKQRKSELLSMEKSVLLALCDKVGLDPYVKEVLI